MWMRDSQSYIIISTQSCWNESIICIMLFCCCRRRRSAVWFSASIPFWFSILCTMATSVSFHAMQHSKLQTPRTSQTVARQRRSFQTIAFSIHKIFENFGQQNGKSICYFVVWTVQYILDSMLILPLMHSCNDAKTSENEERKIESKSWGFLVQFGFRLGMVAKVFAHFVQT